MRSKLSMRVILAGLILAFLAGCASGPRPYSGPTPTERINIENNQPC